MITNSGSLTNGSFAPPRRNAPFDQKLGSVADPNLWIHCIVRLLRPGLASVPLVLGSPCHAAPKIVQIKREAGRSKLFGKVVRIVSHSMALQGEAIVPL